MRGFIAIDGGGSKSEVVLVNELGQILLHKIVNCTNPNDVGIDTSFNRLNDVIKECIKCADNKVEIGCILLAIAGIEFGDTRSLLKERLLNSLGDYNLIVDGDLASVKELGLGNEKNGVVIISGTGFNMAIKKDNQFTNVGGWGYLPDDYLSGFDLGRDALIASSRAIDKVGKDTVLVELLENKYGNNLWYDMAQIYNEGIKGVASLSKEVVKAYLDNDVVARKIIDSRINKLSKIIKSKCKDIKENIKVCLFGGIFENNGFIVEKLKAKLGKRYHINVTNKKTIYGTVSLAIKNINKDVSEDFIENFDRNYKEVMS